MKLMQALPMERYAKYAAHAKTPEHQALVKETVSLIRDWVRDPRISRSKPPGAWCGFGKDSTVLVGLLHQANVPFTALSVNNGGELPQHYQFLPEIKRYFSGVNVIEYRTDERIILIRHRLKAWGLKNGILKKDGTPIDFFDLGRLEELFFWESEAKFHFAYTGEEPACLYFNGVRSAEGMERMFDIKTYGLMQEWKYQHPPHNAFRALPIGKWRDIDVWAYLVERDIPISPVYSMHAVPQKPGRGTFPRTLYYCDPRIFSSTFYKWLAHYAPVLLSEMIHLFPEIEQRFSSQYQTG